MWRTSGPQRVYNPMGEVLDGSGSNANVVCIAMVVIGDDRGGWLVGLV